MPKLNSNLLNEDIPTTKKITVNNIPSNKNEKNLSIYDIIKKEKKSTKEQVGVTLNKEIVDKLKTVVIDTDTTMSELFENLLTPLLSDITIKEENVKMYNEKNKAKGRRKK